MSRNHLNICVFLDADGVLWEDIGPGGIITGKDQAISILDKFNMNVDPDWIKIVISNQTYAARKKMKYFKFRNLVSSLFEALVFSDLIDDYAICYHHPKAANVFLRKNCKCRKPSPGLITRMIKTHNINIDKSSFIGDRITDIQAGANAGIKHLFLITNPRMLEMNDNSGSASGIYSFLPLNSIDEFFLVKGMKHEN